MRRGIEFQAVGPEMEKVRSESLVRGSGNGEGVGAVGGGTYTVG